MIQISKSPWLASRATNRNLGRGNEETNCSRTDSILFSKFHFKLLSLGNLGKNWWLLSFGRSRRLLSPVLGVIWTPPLSSGKETTKHSQESKIDIIAVVSLRQHTHKNVHKMGRVNHSQVKNAPFQMRGRVSPCCLNKRYQFEGEHFFTHSLNHVTPRLESSSLHILPYKSLSP